MKIKLHSLVTLFSITLLILPALGKTHTKKIPGVCKEDPETGPPTVDCTTSGDCYCIVDTNN